MTDNDKMCYPIEFLNSINLPGVPQYKLDLKVGAPIMILRNLRPPIITNGVRSIITSLKDNLIEAIIT